jgi:hypothetical protein
MDFLSLPVQEPSQMQANYRRFKLDEVGEAVALAEEHKSFGELVRYARKHIAPINPDVKLYRSFDRLLADSNIDAVYLPKVIDSIYLKAGLPVRGNTASGYRTIFIPIA